MKEKDRLLKDRNFSAFVAFVPGASYELYQQTLYGEPSELGRLFLTIEVNEDGELETQLEIPGHLWGDIGQSENMAGRIIARARPGFTKERLPKLASRQT